MMLMVSNPLPLQCVAATMHKILSTGQYLNRMICCAGNTPVARKAHSGTPRRRLVARFGAQRYRAPRYDAAIIAPRPVECRASVSAFWRKPDGQAEPSPWLHRAEDRTAAGESPRLQRRRTTGNEPSPAELQHGGRWSARCAGLHWPVSRQLSRQSVSEMPSDGHGAVPPQAIGGSQVWCARGLLSGYWSVRGASELKSGGCPQHGGIVRSHCCADGSGGDGAATTADGSHVGVAPGHRPTIKHRNSPPSHGCGGCGPWAANPMVHDCRLPDGASLNSPARSGSLGRVGAFLVR